MPRPCSDACVGRALRARQFGPVCGCLDAYECCRPNGALRFGCRAKECRADFTVTSGTLFHSHKLPLKSYLLAVVLFANEVKGKNALAMSREVGLSYKASFVLCHKMREAMAQEMKEEGIGGDNETVETDGAYFGGYVKPTNRKENRRDRRLAENQRGKRRVVVAIRERGGNILTTVAKSESAALSFIRERVAEGTEIQADEAKAWNALHARYTVNRINHQEAYSTDEACTNAVESFFSRIRRGEAGHFHHISGPYLHRYAQEAAFREDRRRDSNGEQVRATVRLALAAKQSPAFCGYYQRHKVPA
jgi:hypothetical protein